MKLVTTNDGEAAVEVVLPLGPRARRVRRVTESGLRQLIESVEDVANELAHVDNAIGAMRAVGRLLDAIEATTCPVHGPSQGELDESAAARLGIPVVDIEDARRLSEMRPAMAARGHGPAAAILLDVERTLMRAEA